MNTIENNKLIATFDDRVQNEFCGNKILFNKQMPSLEGRDRYDFNFNEMCYHSKWDWLMPVVERIENTSIGDIKEFNAIISRGNCRIYRLWENGNKDHFSLHQRSDKILSTYHACIEFIKWYNEQSK